MSEHGELRTDLEVRLEPDSTVIIKDPIAGRFYRFSPVQASVLELLNGRLDAAAIAAQVSAKHHTDVLEQQVIEFTGKLKTLLLLDHPYCWNHLDAMRSGRRRKLTGLLSIKLHAFNPDRLLTRLERRLRFCFTPGFHALLCGVIGVAAVITMLNWESLVFSTATLLSLYSIPLILAVVFSVLTVHEFAHGLTLKHFGGKSEEMGILLLYLAPAFYCNVSDAWLLDKRRRIYVSAAGGYLQIVLWAVATIIWRILAPETFASRICLIVVAFSGIQTFFNFNPLIRLDGYYILSDLLEVPNLRSKAFAYIRTRVSALLTGIDHATAAVLSRKEKRLFIAYGCTAALFSVGLIWVMADAVGGWLVREYQTWGIVMAVTIVLMAAPMPKKEAAADSGRLTRAQWARLRKRPAIVLLPLLAAAAAFLPWELKVSGDFTLAAFNRVAITTEIPGNLKAIHVDQGTAVRAGTVLAEIQNLDISQAYEEVKGELAAQRASLDLLKAGTRPEEIDRAKRLIETRSAELKALARIDQERALRRETIGKKETELANALLSYQRTRELLDSGLIARNEADRDRTAYEVQQRELEEAKGALSILEEQTERNRDVKRKELEHSRSELRILLAGAREESIRSTESQVKKLEEKLRILAQQIELLNITSPIEGTIATPYLRNRIGDFLDQGDPLCEVVSDGRVIVELPVPEKEIGDVRLGSPIRIKVRAYPQRWYEARVRSVEPVAAVDGLVRTVVVRGELDNRDRSLRPGMTGVGKILCGKRPIFEIATRRAVRWLRTEFWEYLP